MAKKEPTFTDIDVEKKPSRGRRNRRYKLTRLFKQQGGLCIYCNKPMWLLWKEDNIYERNEERGKPRKLATMEHKHAKASIFGHNRVNNLACSCYECNQDKRDFSHFTYKLMLKFPKLYKLLINSQKNKTRYKYNSIRNKGRKLYEKICCNKKMRIFWYRKIKRFCSRLSRSKKRVS